jgi:2'-5' RNA ligase
MAVQEALPGFDVVPRQTDRLFFALFPDAATAARIGLLAQDLRVEHRLRGNALEVSRFHVTLHHLGDHAGLPTDLVVAARTAAERVSAQPFEVVFDHAVSFAGRSRKPGKKPFVLRGGEGLAAVVDFQRRLGEAMKATVAGRYAEARFTPHLTLLYDDREVAQRPVDPVGWTVNEFVLVHSLIGQTKHIVLGRWPLQAAA